MGREAARRGDRSSCSTATGPAGSSRPGSPGRSTPASRATTSSCPTRWSTPTGVGSPSTSAVPDEAGRARPPDRDRPAPDGRPDHPHGRREGRAPRRGTGPTWWTWRPRPSPRSAASAAVRFLSIRVISDEARRRPPPRDRHADDPLGQLPRRRRPPRDLEPPVEPQGLLGPPRARPGGRRPARRRHPRRDRPAAGLSPAEARSPLRRALNNRPSGRTNLIGGGHSMRLADGSVPSCATTGRSASRCSWRSACIACGREPAAAGCSEADDESGRCRAPDDAARGRRR